MTTVSHDPGSSELPATKPLARAAGPVRSLPSPAVAAAGTGLQALQRTVGNRAVAQLLSGSTMTRDEALRAGSAPVVQRSPDRQAKVDAALTASPPNVGLVKDIDSFDGLPHATLAKLAHILVYNYSLFLGPVERAKLSAIFNAFGTEIGVLAQLDPFLLEKGLKEWPGLMLSIPAVKVSADSFKNTIKNQAKTNLDGNVAYLAGEYQQMGGKEGVDPKAALEDSQSQNERARSMVAIAERMLRIRKDQKQMLAKRVGFKYNENNPIAPTSEVPFKPDNPPGVTWFSGDKDPDYATLNEQWQAAVLLSGQLATRYPWLFGILKDPETADTRLQTLVDKKDDPYQARVEIMSQLYHQLFLAREMKGKAAGDLDWYDLAPIRNRMLSPESSLDSYDILVGRGVVGQRDDEEWWKKFGLTLAADAAMLVVSFATAGAAPLAAGLVAAAMATGIPAARAYAAYEKSKDSDEMNRATVLPGTDLVGAMQGDIQRAEAMALAIEAVLSMAAVAGPVAIAARTEAALIRIAELSAAEQVKLISAATLEKGGSYVSSRTGMTLAELAARVEPGSPAFQRLEREFLDLTRKSVAELTPAERAAVRDALVTAGTDAADLAGRDDQAEPEIDFQLTQVPILTAVLPGDGVSASLSAIQRTTTYAAQFENYSIEQLLTGGHNLPRMDYVFPGKYAGGDQGIDLIGLTIDRQGRRFSLLHWECKFNMPGNEPKLGKTKGGLWVQTGNDWTRENALFFAESTHGPTVIAREQLLHVASQHNGGRIVTTDMLRRRLVLAKTSYIVPEYTLATKMLATIRGIARWKRVGGLYRIPLPFHFK